MPSTLPLKKTYSMAHELTRVKAKMRLSETALKIYSSAIAQIQPDDKDFRDYVINIFEFTKNVSKSNNTKKIKEYVEREVISELCKSFTFDDQVYALCMKIDKRELESKSIIKIQIHPELRPYLLELKGNFSKYLIDNQVALKGSYSIAIYEVFIMEFNKFKDSYKKKYKKTPQKYTLEYQIEDFRKDFAIPDKYLFADIKRQIIEKAKKELEEKTIIKFDYDLIKQSRKVVAIKFTIKNNDKNMTHFLDNLRAFINHMRENFINRDIMYAADLDNEEKKVCISISPDGHLYDKFGVEYDNKKAQKVWEQLYELAKDDKLDCLKVKKGLFMFGSNKYEKYNNKIIRDVNNEKELVISYIMPYKDMITVHFFDTEVTINVADTKVLDDAIKNGIREKV